MTALDPIDDPERALSPTEAEVRNALLPALEVWTNYLTDVGGWRSLDDALANNAAVIIAHRGTPLHVPLAVQPFTVLAWARTQPGRRGGQAVTLSMLIDALRFMRASETTTFVPAVSDSKVVRRPGWWRVGTEQHARLFEACYVPVLTPSAGRPRASTVEPARPPRMTSVGRREPEFSVIDLLRDYLQTTEPTILHVIAAKERRPLATRRAGRPPTRGTVNLAVDVDYSMVHTEALTVHAGRTGGRISMPYVPDGERVSAELARLAEESPNTAQAMANFSTFDRGQLRRQQDWWRVRRSALALPPMDAIDLDVEAQQWRAIEARAAARDAAAPLIEADAMNGSDGPPPGMRPEDMTPEERDWYGCLLPEDK